jgi:hypothetical protein
MRGVVGVFGLAFVGTIAIFAIAYGLGALPANANWPDALFGSALLAALIAFVFFFVNRDSDNEGD